jgi:multisubunit Na+/H+ antiporter MnhB subunit
MIKKTAYFTFVMMALPLVAFAQANLEPIRQIVQAAGSIIQGLIPILIGLAIVVFFWGLIKYVWGEKGEVNQARGRSIMTAGLVALFVMVSLWGIILLAQDALNIQTVRQLPAPRIPSL